MSRLNTVLVGVLALQAVLLGLINLWPERDTGHPRQILSIGDEVRSIEIVAQGEDERSQERVILSKNGESWELASAGGYPADKNKVRSLLNKLRDLKAGYPISSKAQHHRKLGVAKEEFRRKVTIRDSGGKDRTFFIGSSPAYNRVHFRFAGNVDVLSTGPLTTWDLGTAASSWIDDTYVELKKEEIVSFSLENSKGGLEVNKRDGTWILTSTGEALDQSKVKDLVGTFSRIELIEPHGKKLLSSHSLDPPAARLTVRMMPPKNEEAEGVDEDKTDKNLKGASGADKQSARAVMSDKSKDTDGKPTIHSISVGARAKSGYYAKSDSSPFVVEIRSRAAEALLQKVSSDLKKASAEKNRKK